MSTTPDNDRTYSVNELADEAGVTRRTVHYYISQGLLPASGTEGRGTRYGQGHLDRLLLIRELQREHLPLAEIRQRLERLSDAQVADLLATGATLPEPRGTAFDYIQSVLAGTNRRALTIPQPRPALKASVAALRPAAAPAAPAAPPGPAPAPAIPPVPGQPGQPPAPADHSRAAVADRMPAIGPARAIQGAEPPHQVREPAPYAAVQPVAPAEAGSRSVSRSHWERIILAPDVELHVRRPLSRIKNRAVDRLVALARQLLEEDPS